MKTKYDWTNVPDIYNWIGTDTTGLVYAYTNKPTWNPWAGAFEMNGGFKKACNQFSVFEQESSLEERPYD